ncbi:MAG: V-type ATPase subunit, partial [Actinomycetia bacterium]|nr:V-type ATPase subunit [Actinomycetes bacterium]
MDVEPDMARAMKTFRKVPRYGHAVGRIMVHEAALLDWQRIVRLLESGFSECLEILRETEYGPYLEDAVVSEDVEEGLQRFLVGQYSFLDDICAGTYVARFLHLKYDFHNLKVIFKEKCFGDSTEDMLSVLGSLDVEVLEAAINSGQVGHLPRYWDGVVEEVRAAVEADEEDPGTVDAVADQLYLERRLELARMEKSRFLISYARAAIDVANLRILLRGRRLDKEQGYYRLALANGGRLERIMLLDLSGDAHERLVARLISTRYGRMLEEVLHTEDKEVRLTSLDRHSDEYLLEKLGA